MQSVKTRAAAAKPMTSAVRRFRATMENAKTEVRDYVMCLAVCACLLSQRMCWVRSKASANGHGRVSACCSNVVSALYGIESGAFIDLESRPVATLMCHAVQAVARPDNSAFSTRSAALATAMAKHVKDVRSLLKFPACLCVLPFDRNNHV